jgi:RNase H-fold protein (predicted Holliday junction resolvase)
MLKKSLRIIGINPGTRYLGIAVFQDWNLLDWRIKLLDGKWSKKKIDRVIDMICEYVELYELNTIVLKKVHPSRSSKNLGLLVSQIKSLAKRKKMKVYEYSIKELEEIFLRDERHNKKTLAEKMVSDYPFLSYELEKERAHKNPYHIRMFEAVALGAACFQKQLA